MTDQEQSPMKETASNLAVKRQLDEEEPDVTDLEPQSPAKEPVSDQVEEE